MEREPSRGSINRLAAKTTSGTFEPDTAPGLARAAVWAAVWMVRVVLVALEPGLSDAGAKVAVAPGGRPVAEKVNRSGNNSVGINRNGEGCSAASGNRLAA